MVDFPEPETPITTIAAGSGRAASFFVPADIDINSSVWVQRPVEPMRAPYRAAPVAIVWSPACVVERPADSPSLSPRRLGRGCCRAPGKSTRGSDFAVRFSTQLHQVLTYAIFAFRNHFLSRRATDGKNELLDGLSETVFAVATGYKIRRLLHFWAGIAHCNTKTAFVLDRNFPEPLPEGRLQPRAPTKSLVRR
jgi:hypothetical protein